MNKIRFFGLMVVLTLILGSVTAFQVFSSRASLQVSILPQAGTGNLTPAGPTSVDCYSAAYHAASDCDRLASRQIFNASSGRGANGPVSLNCFSEAYHAATDCDRLALAQE